MFNRKKRLGVMLSLLALTLTIAVSVNADPGATIRIDPYWPTPGGEFEIYVTEHTTYEPHILIVMTEETYLGLTGDVTVTWEPWLGDDKIIFSPGLYPSGDFYEATSGKIPPASTTEEGCRYTVASLRDHLGVPEDEPVYWAMGPFLENEISETAQTFRATLPSSADEPRILVYALGKVPESLLPELFNNCVPPTIPGFVIPELSSILLVLASFGALALYKLKRRT